MNTRRIVTAIRQLVTFLSSNAANWAANEVTEQWAGLKALFLLSIAVPAISILIGLIIGRIGYAADAGWCIGVADWIISVGSFVGAALVTLLWVKLSVYSKALSVVGGVSHLSTVVPELTESRIDNFLKLVRGWTVWFMITTMYVVVVPCYRNLTVTAIAGLAALTLAALSVWFNGPWARRLAVIFAGITFLVATLTLVVPGLMSAIRAWSGGVGDGAALRVERTNTLSAIGQDEERQRTKTLGQLRSSFSKELSSIEASTVRCGGYCSDVDRVRRSELIQKIAWIDEGVYFDRLDQSAPRVTPLPLAPPAATSPPVATPPGVGSPVVRVVLPAGALPTPTPATTPRPHRPHTAAPTSDGGNFGIDLDWRRYPDL